MNGGSVLLYGAPGAGKSTVGRVLARQLALEAVDLDAEIERAAGRSVREIVERDGARAFREREAAALSAACGPPERVIALGGGALLSAPSRALAEAAGEVVLLEADLPTLTARIEANEAGRPLLRGDRRGRLAALLASRRAHYASFVLRVDGAPPPEAVALEVRRRLGRHHLRAMGAGYDVLIREGGLGQLGELLGARGLGGPALLVSDSHVAPLYAERVAALLEALGWRVARHVIAAGERSKTLETVSDLWRAGLRARLDRQSTVVALGGGVVGDLAGFAAATFMRDCRWVALPTSLLGMVDASLGGKTGFNLPEGKNLVGAFHPPALVLADPELLGSLPERELRAGLAEVVKHGVVADPVLLSMCADGLPAVRARLGAIVRRAAAVKIALVEADPFERGRRSALGFGHTVGHALEQASGFELPHGEAVAIGMVVEAGLAERLAVAAPGTAEALHAVLDALDLPTEIPARLPRKAIIAAMAVDKKRAAGAARFALPERIGAVRSGIVVDDLQEVL